VDIPLQITFRGLQQSPAIEARVASEAEKLEDFADRITGCRVSVEAQHRRHHQGTVYHVRILMTLPGAELVVSRDPERNHAHEDVYVAIRDAFDAARRQLQDWVHRRREKTAVDSEPT
jgi:ribosome-associated translation inhibitor RaiA